MTSRARWRKVVSKEDPCPLLPCPSHPPKAPGTHTEIQVGVLQTERGCVPFNPTLPRVSWTCRSATISTTIHMQLPPFEVQTCRHGNLGAFVCCISFSVSFQPRRHWNKFVPLGSEELILRERAYISQYVPRASEIDATDTNEEAGTIGYTNAPWTETGTIWNGFFCSVLLSNFQLPKVTKNVHWAVRRSTWSINFLFLSAPNQKELRRIDVW